MLQRSGVGFISDKHRAQILPKANSPPVPSPPPAEAESGQSHRGIEKHKKMESCKLWPRLHPERSVDCPPKGGPQQLPAHLLFLQCT